MARTVSGPDKGAAYRVRVVYHRADGDTKTIYGPYTTRAATVAQATRRLREATRNGRRASVFIQTLTVISERAYCPKE